MKSIRFLAIAAFSFLLAFPRFGLSQQNKTAPAPSRPKPLQPRPSKTAIAGDFPENLDEDLADGLTLDAALERLISANRDLAIKYQDIPKARADILSASLIDNPSVFLDSEGIPYGNYSPRRPGETSYGPTFVQPFDFSGKRRGRIRVAERAEKVLEALYQDAVRQKIDELGIAYLDVLEARLDVRAAESAATRLAHLTEAMRGLAKQGNRDSSEAKEAIIYRTRVQIDLEQANATWLATRRRLAMLLALPAEQAETLRLHGSLRDRTPSLLDTEKLIDAALRTRPDLAAFRLSIERETADVQLTRSERLEDVLLFYTPYQATTFPSQGEKTANGWETGGIVLLPVFDRKQGEIARARLDVKQLQLQTRTLQNAILHEVRRAATEYAASRAIVQRYEKEILPNARQLRDDKDRQFAGGQASLDSLLDAEKEYKEIADQYVRALVHHRRGMLKLNTAVGQRILP